MSDEEILAVAREAGWNIEHQATNDYLIKFAKALMAEKAEPETVMAEYKFQTYAAYKTDGEMKIGVMPEPEQPVAWWNGKETVWLEHELMGTNPPIENAVPLYTAPTPRKPLTDEEMRECAQAMDAEPLADGWPELIKFARALEKAHGITGEQT